jgi:NADPH-dependent 2,4-dienoyl-CoA reductase/sulfur reductase-like enzyme
MSAASAARRVAPDLEIVVVEATSYAAWGLCGIPYFVSGVVEEAEELISHPPDFFRTERRIDLRLNTRATAIDPDASSVTVEADGEMSPIEYSALVVTTGAVPATPSIPGLDDPRVFAVRTLESAKKLQRGLQAGRFRRCLVVGAGYVGLEMAEALVERGCEVTVVERLDQVMTTLDADVAETIEDVVRAHTELILGMGLGAVEAGSDGLVAHLDDGSTVHVDAVILAAGVRPAGELAVTAGAKAAPSGAVLVDSSMRTSLPGVLAAGDCIAPFHRVLGRPTHVPLGPAANKTGRVAGTVAAGGEARFPGVVGTAVAKVFDLTVARTGLTLDEARGAGLAAVARDTTTLSKAKYYPGAVPTRVRIVHEQGGRLLGAQMVSEDPCTAKRIDVIGTALYGGFDIAMLGELDLSYAPPYAPVYDPVLRAAQGALRFSAEPVEA